MSELFLRCSSIGKLMAKPDNDELDPRLVDDDVRAILKKTKRTDEEKDILDEIRQKSLSTGAKTHVRSLVREAIYGYEPADLMTRPILKGRALEDEAIAMLARLTGRPLVKNTQRRNNGLLTGECDVWDEPIRHGRDTKVPYSMESMPIVVADAADNDYWWQMQGYMILWDAESWSVDYMLLTTPEDLIGLEPPALHCVDHIPERLRWTTWLVARDRSVEALIVSKVLAARWYYRQVLNEFDATHGQGPAPADDSPPWAEPSTPTPAKASTELVADPFAI